MRKLVTIYSNASICDGLFRYQITVAFWQKQQASPADSASGNAAGSTIKTFYHSPSSKRKEDMGRISTL